MMPVDTVLVRHGQSEGNFLNQIARKGGTHPGREELQKRHTSVWRLTNRGRAQAKMAGEWLRSEMDGGHFDRFYVSEYLRAKETAAYLGLPDARWYAEAYLREREDGDLEGLSDDQRAREFPESIAHRSREPFFWTPPNGESVARACERVDRVLATLHRECTDKRVILMLHGELMWAFRVRLERLSQSEYARQRLSPDPHDWIHNCQILHYTRRDPESGELKPYCDWMRSVCPTDTARSRNVWQHIVRPVHTNESLLAEAAQVERLIVEE